MYTHDLLNLTEQKFVHIFSPTFIVHSFSFEQILGSYTSKPSYLGGSKSPIADRKDAIRPLVRNWVKLAIQLSHSNGFRVDNCDMHLVLIHQTLAQKPHTYIQRHNQLKNQILYTCTHTVYKINLTKLSLL